MPLQQVLGAQRSPDVVRKDETVLLPQRTRVQALGVLSEPVRLQRLGGHRWEEDLAARALRLRFSDGPAAARVAVQAAPDRQPPAG